MPARIRISSDFIVEAMQSDPVRAALAARARQVKSRADGIATGEGVTMTTEVTEGTRPKGRPYARVSADNAEQEYGDARTQRRRILGRAGDAR